MSFFVSGSRRTIYHNPIAGEHAEGVALLKNCLRPFTKFRRSGVIAATWRVSIDGEEELRTRVVATPLIGVRVNVNGRIGVVVRQETDAVAVELDMGKGLIPLDQLKDAGDV